MRTLGTVIIVLLILHLLAAAGFVGWLSASDRLSKARLQQVVQTFQATVTAEQAQAEQETRDRQQREQLQREAARLESLGTGPMTIDQRSETDREADEIRIQKMSRLKKESDQLLAHLNRRQQEIAKQAAELKARQEAWEKSIARLKEQREDEDFQHAVSLYQKLRPKQTKEMFQQLIEQSRIDDVVDYLAAMQLRQSAAVLGEFKTPSEIDQATLLIQKLRLRGVDPTRQANLLAASDEVTP